MPMLSEWTDVQVKLSECTDVHAMLSDWTDEMTCCQKGLMRMPEPRGENGFTFAHIKASLMDRADLPSSRKYAGP